jgi:protein-disulfide isomerase
LPEPAIEAGLAQAKQLDIRGTPTVILNGLRFAGAINSLQLERLVGDAPRGH